MDTVYAVFYCSGGIHDEWKLLTSSGRGKSPFYSTESTAQSVATWMANNGRYGMNKHHGYFFKVMKMSGEWSDIG